MFAELTKTQRESMDRHRAFKAAIAARAKALELPASPPKLPKPPAQELKPQAFPAEPDPPAADLRPCVWPFLPDEDHEPVWRPIDRSPRVMDIRNAACSYFGVPKSILLSPRKTAPVVYARQVAMYLAKILTKRSLPAIAREFNRDHSTALHNIRKVHQTMRLDADLAYDVATLIQIITGIQQ